MTMRKEEDPVAAAAEIKRSQSSLELLSNTAAWKNVVESQAQGSSSNQTAQSSSNAEEDSSPLSARVSPAEHSLKTNSFASSGDFRKDIGMSFDEATAHVHSPSFLPSNQTEQPGLPLMNNNSNNSSASLVSCNSSNNLQAALPSFTASWQQQLNPSMHAAFTPPRSNLRASSRPHLGDALFGGGATRSLHDSHHQGGLAGRQRSSSDDGETWSFAGASMDSTGIPVGSASSNKLSELDALREENEALKAKLKEKERKITALTQERDDLQSRVDELRQLPTGKISQIPIEDMLELMRTYGSELSDTVMPPRKTKIQKASVIRQFRRWNPNFLEYFQYAGGKWVPKLGKEGELKRREEARRQRRMVSGGPTAAPSASPPQQQAPTPSAARSNAKASQTAAV